MTPTSRPPRRIRLAVVISHPVQHFAPQYRSWSAVTDVRVKVFYASSVGAVRFTDRDFGREVSWGSSLLDGYDYEFLNGSEPPRQLTRRLDAPALDHALDQYAPDALVVYGYAHRFERRARRWALSRGVHLAYVSDSEDRGAVPGLRHRLRSRFVRSYLADVSTCLSVGDANEAYYRSRGVSSDRIVRMGFPIDLASHDAAWARRVELREAVRREWGLTPDDCAVLAVGKFIDRKRHRDLIQAASLMSEETRPVVILAGSGPEEQSLREFAAECGARVIFLGFVPPSRLPEVCVASDVLANPSSFDPHPLVVSEGIYMGLPAVVSSSTGSWGPNDDVVPGVNGLVYPCGDIDGLAKSLEALAKDPDRTERFGRSSHARAQYLQARAHGGWLREFLPRLRALSAVDKEATLEH